ncbi:bifunctional DNA primase/polymerase [Kitasatospora sp. GP82]|uniref:bifunctional DNA primase/polymerase n=1 Tax=Kitasatospora sp. GP82 TaxID=3035089 RepID=UPI0024730EA6|nr:bifunctional DNA primase/polymerase [Kitasatospora sp. GP82]MDH6125923.1 hypothetical protein [Kitasatospora sp. GP82]
MNLGPLPRERRHRAIHAFIDRGCPVSALAPGSKKPMKSCPQCDIKSPDYVRHHGVQDCPHPADLCHGFHAATLDHGKAQSWIDRHPDLNFAVSAGPAGIVVIDLDKNKANAEVPAPYQLSGVRDGFDVFALALERYKAPYPTDAMHVATISGGLHLWFRLPPGRVVLKSEGAFGWLVDVRSTNSYIIGPTSVVGGVEYRRIGHSTAPMLAPAWLLHHLEGTGHAPKPPAPPRPARQRPTGRQDAAGHRGKTLQQLADELASAPESTRHAELCRVTTAAAHLVLAGHIDEHEMRAEMEAAGRAADRSDYEIHKAIETAFTYASRGAA